MLSKFVNLVYDNATDSFIGSLLPASGKSISLLGLNFPASNDYVLNVATSLTVVVGCNSVPLLFTNTANHQFTTFTAGANLASIVKIAPILSQPLAYSDSVPAPNCIDKYINLKIANSLNLVGTKMDINVFYAEV